MKQDRSYLEVREGVWHCLAAYEVTDLERRLGGICEETRPIQSYSPGRILANWRPNHSMERTPAAPCLHLRRRHRWPKSARTASRPQTSSSQPLCGTRRRIL